MIQSKTLFTVRFQKNNVFYGITIMLFYQENFSVKTDCTITNLIIRRLSNKSNGSRSLMDSFSSTKSWLIKKAGWSKSSKTSKKSKNSFNKSLETNDESKKNNMVINNVRQEDAIEPVVIKEVIQRSFDKPLSESMEQKPFCR